MPSPSRRLFGVTFVALLALPLMVGSLRTSSRVIVTEDDVVAEDLYSFGGRTIIEGLVEGDLVAVTGELTISGTIEGDVIGLVGGPVRISGEVGGSVRVAAVSVEVTGKVGDDIGLVAVDAAARGEVGRDILAIAGDLEIAGSVGRSVRGQVLDMALDAAVGMDVIVRVDTLSLGRNTDVGGDLLYKASSDADIEEGASVKGQSTRRRVLAPVWAKAVGRLFAILSLFGFIVAALLSLWLFRASGAAAVEIAGERPFRAALVGLGVVLTPPVMILPLFLTLVGLPVALFLLLAWLVVLFVGPTPAVAWLGARLMRGRGGLAAAVVIGAVAWRGAIWLLPLVGGIIYLAALLVGAGSFTVAAWESRRIAPSGW